MKSLSARIPTYLGNLITIKGHLDQIKNQYDRINLSFDTNLWKNYLQTHEAGWSEKEAKWYEYLSDIEKLFFSEPPYILSKVRHPTYPDLNIMFKTFNIKPSKIDLGHLLCQGQSLDIDGEYIVITTKIRHIDKSIFYPKSIELWSILKQLSEKYKIVILGEREVEKRKEYEWAGLKNGIFGIYEQIISNIPENRVHNLTVQSLGNTPSNIRQVQQDCLIMKEAKFVITLGIGGNFCMSTAVANMAIGWRQDDMWITDMTFNEKEYPNAIITKDWNYFINVLKRYI